jgi:hypothetical protein
VLLHTETGAIVELNETGALLWSALPCRSSAELVDLLKARFTNRTSDVLQSDVDTFIAAMVVRQLVIAEN